MAWTDYLVHPHAGGENSPLCSAVQVLLRFTPTRVGKTQPVVGCPCDACGSPPRGWGKRLRPLVGEGLPRFTPTRVGKTQV